MLSSPTTLQNLYLLPTVLYSNFFPAATLFIIVDNTTVSIERTVYIMLQIPGTLHIDKLEGIVAQQIENNVLRQYSRHA